ncbi:hypothetical protein ACFL1B_02830 [Nanoarchaeota archaeon]
MKIEDVKNLPRREIRSLRANLRLYPSQMKFINDHQISVQAIFDKALEELGHEIPAPEDIDKIARLFQDQQNSGSSYSRGRGKVGKGNIRRQKQRAKQRKR